MAFNDYLGEPVGIYESDILGEQIHFNVQINGKHPVNEWVDGSQPLSVNSVLILPNSYKPYGTPTKLIFMHHGVSGTVTDTSWYSNVQHWSDFYNAYLNAGFAVFDINGAGPYSAADETYHKDYGCPNALQAALKAYEHIVSKYNVDKRIMVHGTSMGGATAVAFTKFFPEIVKAVGLFAPAELKDAVVSTYASANDVCINYGYASQAAAEADDFEECKQCALSIEHYNSSGELQNHNFLYDWENDATEKHIATFPVPIKFWHGTADTSTDPLFSEKAVEALRNGGCSAFYRPVSGAGHNISTGSNSTVINEAVLWFKRF